MKKDVFWKIDKALHLKILTIKKDDNERLQTNLLNSIHYTLQEIHDYSTKQGIETLYFGVTELDVKLEVIKNKKTLDTIGIAISSSYCAGEIKSVKHDQYYALNSLGWQGRKLVTDYPKITEKIIDALSICLEFIKKNPKKLKNINRAILQAITKADIVILVVLDVPFIAYRLVYFFILPSSTLTV